MKPDLIEIQLSDVVFDEDIYPRQGHDPATVQRYAEDMDAIESRSDFISLSLSNKILDGKHRWLAYRKIHEGNGDHVIRACRYDVEGWLDELKLAIELNEHGLPLTSEDKEMDAKKFYRYGITSYEDIATWLHVGKKKISGWLARTVKEARDERDRKILNLWLACHTQEEMADACNCSRETVSDIIASFGKTVLENQTTKAVALHATDFDVPIYNIWKQQEKTQGSSHFGNSEIRWVDNLLYLYTSPLDIVVDPFGGGGTTIDICKKRWRRYWVSDRKPIIEREHEIRCWDMTDGVPPLPRWQDVKLVYLDPPYWKQAEGKYSQDAKDLANMSLDHFTSTLATLVANFSKKLSAGAVIALLIQPTQWNAPERQYTDHVADMLHTVKLPLDMRYSCPYESQQCNAQMVDWAKANKRCLVLTRELIVWRVL